MRKLYRQLNLEKQNLAFNIFEQALRGLEKIEPLTKLNPSLITIIDYSQPTSSKRLYTIDLKKPKLLFNTWVAVGEGSSGWFGYNFSNEIDSNQSSLGFFKTGGIYNGDTNGLCMVMHGLEEGINDNAKQRHIVMHGADYVSKELIEQDGDIGFSQGCPAISRDIAPKLITTINHKSLIYAHYDDDYLETSQILSESDLKCQPE